jgi:periplasmic protein TonB
MAPQTKEQHFPVSRRRAWALCLTALLMISGTPAAAQDGAEIAGWTIFSIDDGCAMFLEYEGPGATQLSYAQRLDGAVVLLITNTGWTTVPEQRYDLTLSFDNTGYDVVGVGVRGTRRGFTVVVSAPSAAELTTQMLRSSGLSIQLGNTTVDELQLRGTARAWPGVQRCLANVAASNRAAERERGRWANIPADPFRNVPATAMPTAPNSPARPRNSLTTWITMDDYPASAQRENREGAGEATLTVGADGRVSNCRISVSTGHADLDEAACRNITRRARFDPALNAESRPVEGVYQHRFSFSLPD